MFDYIIHHRIFRLVFAIFGAFVGSFAMNVFIVPFHLYSGGLLGVGQLIRTFFNTYLSINVTNIDLAGIIYLILNIPILIYSKNIVGKQLMIGTVVGTFAYSVFFTIIPIPETPILSDILTSVIVGGILAGIGGGILLTCGCSGGSLDILGLCFSKKGKKITVGKFSILFNSVLYGLCLIFFSIETAIYSLIFSTCYSISLDRLHQQNINVEVSILTKTKKDEISSFIINKLGRGVSIFDAKGGYTDKESKMLFVCISRYEISRLKHFVIEVDPDAFIVIKEGIKVSGNFTKKLDFEEDY